MIFTTIETAPPLLLRADHLCSTCAHTLWIDPTHFAWDSDRTCTEFADAHKQQPYGLPTTDLRVLHATIHRVACHLNSVKHGLGPGHKVRLETDRKVNA